MSSPSSPEVRLVWHRGRDLRLHDNALYSRIDPPDNFRNDRNHPELAQSPPPSPSTSAPTVASVYLLNRSEFMPRPSTCRPNDWDAVSIGPHAARILLESLQDLRCSLRSIGGDLLVLQLTNDKNNNTQLVTTLLDLIGDLGVTDVRWNEEPGVYERRQSTEVREAIRQRFPAVRIRTHLQCTLYHPDDLPRGPDEWNRLAHPKNKHKKRSKPNANTNSNANAKLTREETESKSKRRMMLETFSRERFEEMPRIMGDFRNAARNKIKILRPCHETPRKLRVPDGMERISYALHQIPSLEELMQPLLRHVQNELDGDGDGDAPANQPRPILGLRPNVLKRIITSALALDQSSSSANDKNNGDGSSNTKTCLRGGETVALHHLEEFCDLHAGSAVMNLADVSNNDSSRLSHYLAFGCLSPRRIVQEASKRNVDNNDGIENNKNNWLISHMTMRDFFLYTCFISDTNFYASKGMPVRRKKQTSSTTDNDNDPPLWKSFRNDQTISRWNRWAEGTTGLPLIDAAVKELVQTGYCSNRVRQNMASVLCNDLRIDWRAGAEFFQLCLVDHCVGANWGNWLYFSGVGPDPKHRHFRTVSQAVRYDPDGLYVTKWLPTLNRLAGNALVEKNDDSLEGKIAIGDTSVGKSIRKLDGKNEAYFRPWDYDPSWNVIVDPATQYTYQDKLRLDETGSLYQPP